MFNLFGLVGLIIINNLFSVCLSSAVSGASRLRYDTIEEINVDTKAEYTA